MIHGESSLTDHHGPNSIPTREIVPIGATHHRERSMPFLEGMVGSVGIEVSARFFRPALEQRLFPEPGYDRIES